MCVLCVVEIRVVLCGVCLCCEWEILGGYLGSECVLCAGEFGVGFLGVCVLSVREFGVRLWEV